METGFFQWCPVTGSEAISTIWNTGGSLWIWWSSISLWQLLRTGTCCPVRLRSLPHLRYSKA